MCYFGTCFIAFIEAVYLFEPVDTNSISPSRVSEHQTHSNDLKPFGLKAAGKAHSNTSRLMRMLTA